MGAFVQPRPGGHHMPTKPHALRMTHQASPVKIPADPPGLPAHDHDDNPHGRHANRGRSPSSDFRKSFDDRAARAVYIVSSLTSPSG